MRKRINILLDLFFIVLGVYLISIGTNIFLLPHKMTSGGASGIATILYYTLNIPMGLSIVIINLPLFLISIYKFGFKFSFKTIAATILLSIFLEVFKYNDIIENSPTDLFTSCIFGGILTGLGLSIVFKAGASTGGSDLLAQIIFKMIRVEKLSNILIIIEVVIISSIIIVFKDINIGLYSLVALFISTKVIDLVFSGVDYVKVVTIITKKTDKIIEPILNDLKRGATVTNSLGAHSKEEITTITCIITRPQIAKIRSIIHDNDSDAIMYITSAIEATGNGFDDKR